MHPTKLTSIPLFESLKKRDLQRLAGWVDETQIDAGREIIHEGHTAYEFFVILEGMARVLRGGEEVGKLGPGDFFGEIALEGHGPRTASVVAETPMRLAVVFEREFHLMEDELPAVAARIREAIQARRPN
jgi:CRP/FNR family transcriptional regulator, cyclic AMP receptor protein